MLNEDLFKCIFDGIKKKLEKLREENSKYDELFSDFKELLEIITDLDTLCSILENCLPSELKKSSLNDLQRHISFVRHFTEKKDDAESRERNLKDAFADYDKLQREVYKSLPKSTKLDINIEDIKDTEIRNLFKEALICFNSGCYRATICMVGVSLEKYAREIFEKVEKKSSKDLKFAQVIDGFTEKVGGAEGIILNICRQYRNFCVHPSEEKIDPEEARSILTLAFKQIIKKE